MTECDGIGRELKVVTVNTSTAGLEEGGRERREGGEKGRGERVQLINYHIILATVSLLI